MFSFWFPRVPEISYRSKVVLYSENTRKKNAFPYESCSLGCYKCKTFFKGWTNALNLFNNYFYPCIFKGVHVVRLTSLSSKCVLGQNIHSYGTFVLFQAQLNIPYGTHHRYTEVLLQAFDIPPFVDIYTVTICRPCYAEQLTNQIYLETITSFLWNSFLDMDYGCQPIHLLIVLLTSFPKAIVTKKRQLYFRCGHFQALNGRVEITDIQDICILK